jgi:hypothetical protein
MRITADFIQKIIDAFQKYIEGEKPLPIYAENFNDLTFSELEEELQSLAEDAIADGSAWEKRQDFMAAFSEHRDAVYAHSGYVFQKQLGLNNCLRCPYEKFKHVANAASDRSSL